MAGSNGRWADAAAGSRASQDTSRYFFPEERGQGRRPLLPLAAAALLVGVVAWWGTRRFLLAQENLKKQLAYKHHGRLMHDYRRHVALHRLVRSVVLGGRDPALDKHHSGDESTVPEQVSTPEPLALEESVHPLHSLNAKEVLEQTMRQVRDWDPRDADAATDILRPELQTHADDQRLPREKENIEELSLPLAGAPPRCRGRLRCGVNKPLPFWAFLLLMLGGRTSLRYFIHLRGGIDPAAPSGPSPFASVEPMSPFVSSPGVSSPTPTFFPQTGGIPLPSYTPALLQTQSSTLIERGSSTVQSATAELATLRPLSEPPAGKRTFVRTASVP
ncbi:hypothetical protein BESB_033600 [Besnoitia besnoiti]|uniref:Transmembrane protein n=1 Tax=Besnoitia besnoiti TaxID=94643 RepID=A0A2A9MMU8_BESBE|nr:hypothetical protein BESB_033600 [Besnoitia besnoiti]PFH36902.1 hypothetical protein BESB_033600 [Besnoitia besnoiti]